MDAVTRSWPEAGETKIPYWVDTDKELDQTELENRCIESCQARSWA